MVYTIEISYLHHRYAIAERFREVVFKLSISLLKKKAIVTRAFPTAAIKSVREDPNFKYANAPVKLPP